MQQDEKAKKKQALKDKAAAKKAAAEEAAKQTADGKGTKAKSAKKANDEQKVSSFVTCSTLIEHFIYTNMNRK